MVIEIIGIFAKCLILTIIIEGFTSFILGYRKIKEQLIVLLINVATNPVAVYCGWIIAFFITNNILRYCLILLVELIVIIIEAIMLKRFNSKQKLPFWIISIINNATSFIIGLII